MSFNSFSKVLSKADIEFEELKEIQMAQAIKESGRGKSALFRKYNNPFGMKYRSELSAVCTPVKYTDWEGIEDHYCSFPNFETAVSGYWLFIDRAPYLGWRMHARSPKDFVRFIVFAGYLGGTALQREAYVESILELLDEAKRRLEEDW